MAQNFIHKLTVFDTPPAELSHMLQKDKAAQHEVDLADAFAKGKEAGRQEMESQAERHAANVTTALSALIDSYETQRADIEKSHHIAVLKILASVLPKLAKERAGTEIAAAILQLAHHGVDGKLTVHVPPNLTSEIIEQVKACAERIDLFENANLTENQARVSWHGGGLDIDVAQAVATCLKCLSLPDAFPQNETMDPMEESPPTPSLEEPPSQPVDTANPNAGASPASPQNTTTGDNHE